MADVRRYPGSRRWPHFAQTALAMSLEKRGLVYLWFPELGGRRTPRVDSPNTTWRNPAFRGYADYMETAAFADGLGRLVNLAFGLRTAVMCAEALWWRCHRGLIADVLRWLGFGVIHILGPGSTPPTPTRRQPGLCVGGSPIRPPALPDRCVARYRCLRYEPGDPSPRFALPATYRSSGAARCAPAESPPVRTGAAPR